MWGWNVPLPVPAGALIPKGVYGILAAGRNVSVDHDIALGLRMKDDVQKSGEAAARLAAAAIRAGVDVREADTDALREKLFASGCLKAQDEEVRIEKQHYNEVHAFPLWCDDDGAIAGSTTNVFDELKNLHKTTNAPFGDVVLAATANPAKQVGIFGVTGSIAPGKRADLLLTDGENVILTVSRGKPISA